MHLSSSSMVNGKIQKEHACAGHGGSDKPLQLSIRGVPADARFIAIVSDDPDAKKPAGKVWVHWNVFNVPASSEMDIQPGQSLAGDVGVTTGHARGYEGMCPPDGTHTYRFAVFASKDKLQLGASPLTIDEFESRHGGHVLAKAIITGQFG